MLDQMDAAASEYGAIPKHLLVFNPEGWGSLEGVTTPEHLVTHNFLGFPDPSALYEEHGKMTGVITEVGHSNTQVIDLADLIGEDPKFQQEAQTNPNLFFTRDSIAWSSPSLSELVVVSAMGLPARQNEPGVVAKGLEKLGYEPYQLTLPDGATIEGGDVIPLSVDGQSFTLVGIGERTSMEAAMSLAKELPTKVIAIHHPEAVLHLDTGLCVYPGAAVVAEGMFEQATLLNANGKPDKELDLYKTLDQWGFEIVTVSQQAAIDDEVCNVAPFGDGVFVGFDAMEKALTTNGQLLAKHIVDLTGVDLHTISGEEMAKTTGGVHCSTHQLY